MKKCIQIKTVELISSGRNYFNYEVVGNIWDGNCHCSDEAFVVRIETTSEKNENQLKKFLKNTEFESGTLLDFELLQL